MMPRSRTLSFVYRNGESDIHQLPEFAGAASA